ncbi:CcdB family protein [Brevundimonas sp. TWP2-3-4b1]|uniref:CcdB family protein n=1 Tax=Brevundimonas sp. TWP2-3-4b1 TaxID=2804580 RepID=UPI003CEDDF84
MRQFDVYENPSAEARRFAPFVVVVSSHLIPGFDDAVVAPLVNDSTAAVAEFEIPVVVDEQPLVIVLTELAGVQGRSLKRRVGSLLAHEDDIRRALDRLFPGF